MERGLGAGRRRARGQPRASAPPSSGARSRRLARGAARTARGGAGRRVALLTAPVQARVLSAGRRRTTSRRARCRRRRSARRREACGRAGGCAASRGERRGGRGRCGARSAAASSRRRRRAAGTATRRRLSRSDRRGDVTAAPPKQVRPASSPSTTPRRRPTRAASRAGSSQLLRRSPWLRFVALLLAVLRPRHRAARRRRGRAVGGIVHVVAGAAAWLYLRASGAALSEPIGCDEAEQTPEAVDRLPASPDFAISDPATPSRPRPARPTAPRRRASRAPCGRRAPARRSQRAARRARAPALDVAGARDGSRSRPSIPTRRSPRRVLRTASLSPSASRQIVAEQFQRGDGLPGDRHRRCTSRSRHLPTELFLPNLNLIEPNSITLLETNQRFIEAYMVGLNHEFARELLWREYPTDQRGSYFRQFWDVSSSSPRRHDAEPLRENLRDIPPLHRWSRRSELGDHDNREADGDGARTSSCSSIRGELLKQYPNAVIYAHRARWQRTTRRLDRHEPGARARRHRRSEEAPTAARQGANAALRGARSIPTSTSSASISPPRRREGETPQATDDDPGWFFVIKERPGEPRFGLDIERDGALKVWNDLAWPDVRTAGQALDVGAATPTFTLTPPTEPEKATQQRRRPGDLRPA